MLLYSSIFLPNGLLLFTALLAALQPCNHVDKRYVIQCRAANPALFQTSELLPTFQICSLTPIGFIAVACIDCSFCQLEKRLTNEEGGDIH